MAGGNINKRIVQARLNEAIEKLKSGSPNEISEAIKKLDINELSKKLSQLDPAAIKEYESTINDARRRISDEDLKKLSAAIGPKGPEIAARIRSILNNRPK